MRLIDADTLRAEFTGNFGRELWHYTGIHATIDVAPTIDAVPVVHARWEHFGRKRHGCIEGTGKSCSACGYSFARLHPDNYCPHCGARMDKEENDVQGTD